MKILPKVTAAGLAAGVLLSFQTAIASAQNLPAPQDTPGIAQAQELAILSMEVANQFPLASNIVSDISGAADSLETGLVNQFDPQVELQNISTIQPGVLFINPETQTACTLGFAKNEAQRTFQTAGHCGAKGDEVVAYLNGERTVVGSFESSTQGKGDADIATIKINPGFPISANIALENKLPTKNLNNFDILKEGVTFCKVGSTTGKTCGSLLATEGNDAWFDLRSLAGDSGSPIYAIDTDGSIVNVARLISFPVPDRRISIGQLNQ